MIPLITETKLPTSCSKHDLMSSTYHLIRPPPPPPLPTLITPNHDPFASSTDHSDSYDDCSTSSDEQSISSSHHSQNSSDHSQYSTDYPKSYGDLSINLKCPLHKSSNSMVAYSASVPFKWEEAPGKPVSQELTTSDDEPSPALQLPPKLHGQAYHSPLQSPYRVQSFNPSPYKVQPFTQSPCRFNHVNQNCLSTNQEIYTSPSNPSSCISSSNNQSPNILHPHSQKLKKLYKLMLKTASWSQPPTRQPWSSCDTTSDVKQDEQLAIHDWSFFDKASPKDLKYSASMSCVKPDLPLYDESHKEFSTLPIFNVSTGDREYESMVIEYPSCDSSASSPIEPIVYPEREGFNSQSWLLATASMSRHERIEECEGDDDGFNDVLITGTSLDKPSHILEVSDEMGNSSPPPWFLDFSPCEEDRRVKEAHTGLVSVLTLIKFKNIIMSKIYKLTRRKEVAFQHANTMWSPTLATYLYNLQNKERNSIPFTEYVSEEEHRSSDEEGPLKINYHLPSMIRGQLVSYSTLSNSARDHDMMLSSHLTFSQEEDEDRTVKHRVSLRERLAEFDDDENPEQTAYFCMRSRQHAHCKRGTCKFQKTVRVLAATIKLILVRRRSRERTEETFSKLSELH